MTADNGRQRYVDKHGLGEYLNVSHRTVEKWTQQRRIPFVRLSSGCVRFDLDEIDKFMAERTVEAKRTVEAAS